MTATLEPLAAPALPVPPTPNLPLLRKVLDHIDAHPEEWTQSVWFFTMEGCGTTACVAGWATLLSGWTSTGPETVQHEDGRDGFVDIVAAKELGLTWPERAELFLGGNTREDVQRAAEKIAARAGETL